MQEVIERLAALQGLDAELGARRKIIADFPAAWQELEQEAAREQAALAEKRGQLESLKKELRRKEGGLQDGEEHIRKSYGKLNEVKTNKEYEATLKEIDGQKQRNSALEEEILLLFDQIEAAEAALQENERTSKAFAQEMAGRKNELQAEKTQAEAEAAELEGRRGALAAQFDALLLAQYERLKKGLGDAVVAAVNETCTACNRMLPAQMYNQVLKKNQIVHCPACGRFLVSAGPGPGASPAPPTDA